MNQQTFHVGAHGHQNFINLRNNFLCLRPYCPITTGLFGHSQTLIVRFLFFCHATISCLAWHVWQIPLPDRSSNLIFQNGWHPRTTETWPCLLSWLPHFWCFIHGISSIGTRAFMIHVPLVTPPRNSNHDYELEHHETGRRNTMNLDMGWGLHNCEEFEEHPGCMCISNIVFCINFY